MERLTIEYCGEYVPKELCTVNRLGEAEDFELCHEYCTGEIGDAGDCKDCAIQKCFDRLAVYEDMQEQVEQRIEKIKASTCFPRNFTGQIVEDLEWVMSFVAKK